MHMHMYIFMFSRVIADMTATSFFDKTHRQTGMLRVCYHSAARVSIENI